MRLHAVPLGYRKKRLPDPRKRVLGEPIRQPPGDKETSIHPVAEPVARAPLDALNIKQKSRRLHVPLIMKKPGRLSEDGLLDGERPLFVRDLADI
ncbi:hypothetical protein JCM4914_74400 [Streptomyces platensis subsp. malvinus]